MVSTAFGHAWSCQPVSPPFDPTPYLFEKRKGIRRLKFFSWTHQKMLSLFLLGPSQRVTPNLNYLVFFGGEYMFWIKRSWYPVSNLDVGILISWDKKRDSIYYIIYVLCVEKGRSRWAPTIQFRKRRYHTTAGPFPLESIFQHLKEYTRKAQHSKGYLGFLVAFAFDPILCWIKDLFEPKFVQ